MLKKHLRAKRNLNNMSYKLKRSGKPCPECNKYLYWTVEQEYIDNTISEHKVLLCPACGYIEPHKPRKRKKASRQKEME